MCRSRCDAKKPRITAGRSHGVRETAFVVPSPREPYGRRTDDRNRKPLFVLDRFGHRRCYIRACHGGESWRTWDAFGCGQGEGRSGMGNGLDFGWFCQLSSSVFHEVKAGDRKSPPVCLLGYMGPFLVTGMPAGSTRWQDQARRPRRRPWQYEANPFPGAQPRQTRPDHPIVPGRRLGRRIRPPCCTTPIERGSCIPQMLQMGREHEGSPMTRHTTSEYLDALGHSRRRKPSP